ncbi:MAG: ThuA domain-containing protein [Acidobacteriota bacterium]|nr:ThuA domain-containing protein [Acidobacteriota bacterium]
MRGLIAIAVMFAGCAYAADNLIVCDEVPAMRNLSAQIETRLHETSEITQQDKLPERLAGYKNVIVYIHGALTEAAETRFIDYAKNGGKLVLLHHTISSGKRKNRYWFAFLGVTLPESYKYIDDATWDVTPLDGGTPFTMHETEIYLNHELDSNRTLLLGLKYKDPKTGEVFEQKTAGWVMKTGKGTVYYFMPGHKATDFEYEPYVGVLMKAIGPA